MNALEHLAREIEQRLRSDRAKALRAIRKVDKPLARYVAWRFKQTDIAMRARADALAFGTSMVRIDPKDWPL